MANIPSSQLPSTSLSPQTYSQLYHQDPSIAPGTQARRKIV